MASHAAATATAPTRKLPAVAKPVHPMPLRPGFILIQEFSAKGGVKFQRTGAKRASDSQTMRRIIDHPELERLTRAITNGAYGLLMSTCASTPLGFYADQEMLDIVLEKIEEFKLAAYEFNTVVAPRYKSERHMTVDIYHLPWDTKDVKIATRTQQMIREHLLDLRAAMTTMHRDTVKMHFDRMRNMEKVTTGKHHDCIKAALDAMRDQRRLLSKTPPAKVNLGEFDFRKIDAAISYLE